LIGERLLVHLDVVEHRLAERRDAAVQLEIGAEQAVDVGVSIDLLEEAEVHDVQEPGLETAVLAGPDVSFPQRHGPRPRRMEPEAVLHHEAPLARADRIDARVELGHHRLQLDPRRAEGEAQVIEPVRIG